MSKGDDRKCKECVEANSSATAPKSVKTEKSAAKSEKPAAPAPNAVRFERKKRKIFFFFFSFWLFCFCRTRRESRKRAETRKVLRRKRSNALRAIFPRRRRSFPEINSPKTRSVVAKSASRPEAPILSPRTAKRRRRKIPSLSALRYFVLLFIVFSFDFFLLENSAETLFLPLSFPRPS